MDDAIAAQAKTKGNVKIISTDANGDAAKLAANVEDLLSKNVDAIIISGGPLESAPAALNAIKAARKPVVLVDRKFATGEYTSWIGPDNEAIGKQDGEFLAKPLTRARSPSSRAARRTTASGWPAPTGRSRRSAARPTSPWSRRPTSATGAPTAG